MFQQTFSKDVPSIKTDTQELKTAISTVKGVHDIKKILLPYSIQGLEHNIHVEKYTHNGYVLSH